MYENDADTSRTAGRKVVIYCRVSSVGQTKRGDGLGSQEATSRQYAERMGYEVMEVFRDSFTGGSHNRPGLSALLRYLRQHKGEGLTIVIDDLDRFGKDLLGHLELREVLKASGNKLESPKMKFGDRPEDRLLENVMMSAAQFQREHNAEQTLDRMKGRLVNGYWPFVPPRAMRNQRVEGLGRVLVRVEPEASVIAEGLEAFASGRLRTQAEFARYLNQHPDYSKGRSKGVTHQQAHIILTNCLYAGMIEKPDWGIERKKGKHQGLVSYETFERIQARLAGNANAPARADVSDDFPLRGSVVCAHCGHGLTACWSKSKTGARHAYYMCFARGCVQYRKSIRRGQIEGEFARLLEGMTHTPRLVKLARALFRSAWDQRMKQIASVQGSYDRQIAQVDRQISALLDRIVDAGSPTIMAAFEKRIGELERSKLVLSEKRSKTGEVKGSFEELFELAFSFLSNPKKLWDFGKLEYRKTVLRLAFSERLAYSPEEGFRTPKTTMPFSMLGDVARPFEGMAEREGFEPSRRLPAYTLSRRAPSTTRPSLR